MNAGRSTATCRWDGHLVPTVRLSETPPHTGRFPRSRSATTSPPGPPAQRDLRSLAIAAPAEARRERCTCVFAAADLAPSYRANLLGPHAPTRMRVVCPAVNRLDNNHLLAIGGDEYLDSRRCSWGYIAAM
jgi:hypothetical protein